MPGSGEVIDFSLRPNKNVERKLIAECLVELSKVLNFKNYQYIGMGAYWFADFMLFHRRLGINRMWSIELSEYADRAEFNRPLKIIKVKSGDSTSVLPEMRFDSKTIVWLDYDSDLNGPWKDDLSIILNDMPAGGLVFVTVNAHHNQVSQFQEELLGCTKVAAMESRFGSLFPTGKTLSDMSMRKFPIVVSELLFNHCTRTVRTADPDRRFEPLVNYRYADNAPMITIGGIVVDDDLDERLRSCSHKKLDYVTGKDQFEISLPALTHREKLAIDRLLPMKTRTLTSEDIRAHLKFNLDSAKVIAYQKFYNFYPNFSEFK